MPDAKNHYTTGFFQVQQGTTGDCIGKNGGQLAADKMSTIYNSLTSASPQLFTYPACVSSLLDGRRFPFAKGAPDLQSSALGRLIR